MIRTETPEIRDIVRSKVEGKRFEVESEKPVSREMVKVHPRFNNKYEVRFIIYNYIFES